MPDTRPSLIVDANLVIWAHHSRFDQHESAGHWWSGTLASAPQIGIPWPTILAFLRISTHSRALERPLHIDQAWNVVSEWLERPNVWTPAPTERHPSILGPLLLEAKAGGNHTTDAHLAALAIEWGLELQTADRGFSRFPGLRWQDPLADG